jgi:hypothetical protein
MSSNEIFGKQLLIKETPAVKFVLGRLAVATNGYCKKHK